MSKDYYKILGVEKNASPEEIKKAFRKLAHQHHPDKQGGNEAKFKEANEAYQVLGDPEKRKKYDQFGSAAFDGQGFGGNAGGWDFSGFQNGGFAGGGWEDLGDIFGDFFGAGTGGGRHSSRTSRGSDIQVDLELTFKESVFGVDKEIQLTKNSSCERCGATGGEPGSELMTCLECQGSGVTTGTQRTILGMIQTKRSCSRCDGRGEIPKKPCTACGGSGIEKRRQTLSVHIPAGVDEGSVLRVRGEGEAVKGGAPGDLFVRLHVKPDARFERAGANIHSERMVGFTQAALGDTVEVETVDGPVSLSIPSGTQSGAQLRLRGKGVASQRGRGDHIVHVRVVTPRKLSRQQKKLLEELGLNE